MTEHNLEARGSMQASASATATVIRGEKSWTFLYLVAGFAVSTEATVVQMIEPLHWLAREALFAVVAGLTLWQVLASGSMQDRLLRWQATHEGRAR